MQKNYLMIKKFVNDYNKTCSTIAMQTSADLVIDYKDNYTFFKTSSLRVGGDVALYIIVNHEDSLFELVTFLVKNKINYFITSDGNNVVVKNSGYNGVVISFGGRFKSIFFDNNMLYANSAVSLERLSHEARIRNLSGLEFATLLTHSLSTAIIDNLSAFGSSIYDNITSLRVLDVSNDNILIKQIKKDNYLNVEKKDRDKLIILSVAFKLNLSEPSLIDSKIEAYRYIRGSVAPLEPSLGPVFISSEKIQAYEMVERVGGLDMKVGFMQWHKRLPNYVINTQKLDNDNTKASADDAITLIEETKKRIESHYDIKTETNITILGSEI